MKPTYIGIGAQKCASNWVHRILAAHPDVCVCSSKEIDFFSLYFDRGYQWYERQFEHCESAVAVGEISPSYFYDPSVPHRVKAYAPDIKIILSLRHPLQRALSNHRHEVRVGHFKGPDFSFESGLANNPMYVEQSLYATHLKRWLQCFSREQILVILVEDVESAPSEVARRVYSFVGVDSEFLPSNLDVRFNRSYANRSAWLLGVKEYLYQLTRVPGLTWIWGLCSSLGLKSMYRSVNQVSSDAMIPLPSQETLSGLRQRFAPEIAELEKLLQRSLESWRF